MSYSPDEAQENNENSREQKAIAEQLSRVRCEIERAKDVVDELKDKEKGLEERMSMLKQRNNRIAENAGLEAPAPGQKPTKGWWRQIRAKPSPPFTFEGIPGKFLKKQKKTEKFKNLIILF